MDLITCPHCRHAFAPAADQKPPPWCRRCGGDLAGRPVGVAQPADELVALTAADSGPRPVGSRWGNQPAVARPATVVATPRPADDTPAPAGGRWANRKKPRLVSASTWTADLDRQAEEQVARQAGLRPPAFECYLFVVACACLPIATLGGGMWFAIGFGGASTCAKLAHSHGLSRPVKLLACLGITAAAWGLFLVLLLAVAGLTPPPRR